MVRASWQRAWQDRVGPEGLPPMEFTPEALGRVFSLPMMVLHDPETGFPIPLPRTPEARPVAVAGQG